MIFILAERARFELAVPVTAHSLSPAQSGKGEIRTLGAIAGTQSFQDCQLNHSCTFPLYAGLRFVDKFYMNLKFIQIGNKPNALDHYATSPVIFMLFYIN